MGETDYAGVILAIHTMLLSSKSKQTAKIETEFWGLCVTGGENISDRSMIFF